LLLRRVLRLRYADRCLATLWLRSIVAGQRPAPEVTFSSASNKRLRRQFFQQRLRFFQIASVEPFSEPPVDRSQEERAHTPADPSEPCGEKRAVTLCQAPSDVSPPQREQLDEPV